uniref:Uncharacterized protein n=1 Tax=Anguilla anguilla TaxID=7936 RepID=A0A0E9RZZ7_ANGAN
MIAKNGKKQIKKYFCFVNILGLLQRIF